ncbi:hypothetical protein ACHAW6_000579 [Cyclotella cf. meneghiniana]
MIQLEHEGQFSNEYLMSLPAHKKVSMSRGSFGRTHYCCWFRSPFSRQAAAYLAVDDFVDALNLAHKLDIDLPKTSGEWDEIYEQYKIKSTNEIMASCVEQLMHSFITPTNTYQQRSC